MQSFSSFGILLLAVFVISALGAENTTTPVTSPSLTNSSSSAEATDVPKSEISPSDQKLVDPTRPPASDTTTPALVRDPSSTTPVPKAAMANNLDKNKTVDPAVSTKKEEKGSGASAVNAGVVIIGFAILISGYFP